MEVDEVLAQFGCMQTQDKEELVNQMLRLVGTNINYTTARFYLEMNQWNVQAAVCSYFDLETVNSTLPGERLSLSCFPTDPMWPRDGVCQGHHDRRRRIHSAHHKVCQDVESAEPWPGQVAPGLYPQVLHGGAAGRAGQSPGGASRALHSHGHLHRDDVPLHPWHLWVKMENVHRHGKLLRVNRTGTVPEILTSLLSVMRSGW